MSVPRLASALQSNHLGASRRTNFAADYHSVVADASPSPHLTGGRDTDKTSPLAGGPVGGKSLGICSVSPVLAFRCSPGGRCRAVRPVTPGPLSPRGPGAPSCRAARTLRGTARSFGSALSPALSAPAVISLIIYLFIKRVLRSARRRAIWQMEHR